MEKEVLRLFKGYLGNLTPKIHKEALKYGLLIPVTANDEVVANAIELFGKDGEKWNQSFHKSFNTVQSTPIEVLVVEQLVHYFTTYGFEDLGIYDSETVYVPKEKLDIPELAKDIELISILPLTSTELSEKLMVLLTSGIALSKQSVQDIMVLSDYIDKNKFDEVKNREVKIALYDKYNIMPKNPDEFLRYLLFKLTGNTLKVQSDYDICCIQNSNKQEALTLLKAYLLQTNNGYEKLSAIFLRNKKLFLALKVNDNDVLYKGVSKTTKKEINHIINRLRKLADKNHKPLNKNILDCLTDKNVDVDINQLTKELDKITVFREIRILNGILYRLNGNDNIVYKIRNGKAFVSKVEEKTAVSIKRLETISQVIERHLITRISNKVSGKSVCIPQNIVYAAPTSEKQFVGNIPMGSYVEMPREGNVVFGVYWKNLSNERVDLDLKLMNKSDVFGWDGKYKNSNLDILFSGDMTDAPLPKGASELFYVGKTNGYGAYLVTLNMFTCNSKDVPFEFVIAKSDDVIKTSLYPNYYVDPNKIMEKYDMVISNNAREMVIGLIAIGESIRFYFNDFSTGSLQTSHANSITLGAFDYLQSFNKIQLKLGDLLQASGATVVETNTLTIIEETDEADKDGNPILVKKEVNVDIDLSPNKISKDSIIELLS